MAGKTYSAGTIFLQVVPVFGDMQREIAREVKGVDKTLGDEMEKAGQKAGQRAGKAMGEEIHSEVEKSADKAGSAYAGRFQEKLKGGLRGVQKELDTLHFDTLSDSAKDNFERVRRLAKDLDLEITADMDDKKVLAKLEFLKASLNELTKGKHRLALDSNLRSLVTQFDGAIAYIEAEVKKKRDFHFGVDVDRKQLDRAMGTFEKRVRDSARRAADALGDSMNREIKDLKKELESLADMEIGIDISDAEAKRKMDDLIAKARRLSLSSPEISVKFDAGKAEAEMLGIYTAANALDGKNIDIKVDVDTGGALAKMGLLKGLFNGSGTDAAANSFRSFNAIVLAAVTLLPALIPVIGAVGGALLALGPILASVGAGVGAMILGFSGIGDAVGALGAQADSAAKDSNQAGKTMQAASYAVADAKNALADAERSAGQAAADAARQVAVAREQSARAIEDALKRQADAQQTYRDAVRDVADAEKALRDAREQAKKDAHNTGDKIKDNALDIRQAQLDAFNATNNLNSVMADGSSTTYDKEQAQINFEQAQQHLHELRDTQKQLAADKVKQDKGGIAGDKQVKSAQDSLTAALEAQKDAQDAVGEAAEAVKRARIDGARAIADAVRNQQRAEASGARNVARAQESLRRANEAYGQALHDTGELGSASMQKLEQAMGKLGPAGRKFARFIFGLRDDLFALRSSVQEVLLPYVQSALEGVINTYGPRFEGFMVKMAGVTGQFFQQLGQSLTGPAWAQFFATMDKLGPKMFAEFGEATLNWLETFANIMTAVAPFSERFSRAMLSLSEAANRWSASEKGQNGIKHFMEYAAKVGPDVMSFLGAFVGAFVNLARALAPLGDAVLNGLTGLLNFIAGMDPKQLGLIATAIISMVVAFQAAVGATAAFYGGLSAFQTIGGKAVFGVVGLAATLLILSLRFESVRNALKSVGRFLVEHRQLVARITSVVLTAVAAYKAYRAIVALMAAVQLGYAAATYGAVGATYASSRASKAAYLATRAWQLMQKSAIIWTYAMAVAQWALNVSLLGFPLIWIILAVVAVIAILVLLYKKNETFRKIVDKAWALLKKAAVAVFGAIVDAFNWVVEGAKKLWIELQPVFAKLGELIVWLWKNVFYRYLQLIVLEWKTAFRVMAWVFKNVLWPILDLIIHLVTILWKKVYKPYLTAIITLWRTVFKAMAAVWKNVLWPVFKALFSIVAKFWKTVFKVYIGLIKAAWSGMATAMKWTYNHFIKPLIEAFMDLVGGKDGLQSKFEAVVGAIETLWSGLRKVFAAPILFVLDTVINKGLIGGFNKIANFVGSDPMKEIPIPKAMQNLHTGGVFGRKREQSYRTGGTMPGFTPGRDVHHFTSPTGGKLNLSGGEAVMRPEWTQAVSPSMVDYWNAEARRGGKKAVQRAMGFSLGGVLPGAVIRKHESGYNDYAADLNVGSGYDDYGLPIHAYAAGFARAFDYGYDNSYGRGVTIDHGTYQTLYAHMSRIATSALGKVAEGTTVGYVGDYGNTGTPPTSHLHFEIGNGWSLPYTSAPGSSDGNYGSKDPDKGGGHHFPGWLVSVAKDPLGYVKSLVTKPYDAMKEKFGNNGLVKAAMSLPMHIIGDVKSAVVGMLPGPLKAVAGGIKGAAEGVGDAVNGAIGSIPGLATGGLIGRDTPLPYNGTMKYDAGGYLPPGLTSVVNLTGKPEPVFTNDQFKGMEGQGRGGIHYEPHFEGSDLTASDVVDDFEFAARKLSRSSGKYERSIP